MENSVDAGATKIDVRLKGSGTELLEVIDNGYGVREVDFDGLSMKSNKFESKYNLLLFILKDLFQPLSMPPLS